MFLSGINCFCYQKIAKPIFFRFDPEDVHDRMIVCGKFLGNHNFYRAVTRWFFDYQHKKLGQNILGINFPNPVGLTAGFDKNAELTQIIPEVGFGFEEIGSVTGETCEGNPKPRLCRFPKTKGLVVCYVLKNDGCKIIAKRLAGLHFKIPIGTSVARTNIPDASSLQAGIDDYVKAFTEFSEIGDYTVINISCPNTCGGEPFSNPERLELLLTTLDQIKTKKPVFVKTAVDLSTQELDTIVACAKKHKVDGFIVSNLTKKHDRDSIDQTEIKPEHKGGISGKPVFELSNNLIAHLYKTNGDRFVIIGSGGIFSAKDAYQKICFGASLVQLATGMIFEGPQVIGDINRGLVKLLEKDGFKSISEAIGSKVK